MKMIKKLLAVLMAACLMAGMLGVVATEARDEEPEEKTVYICVGYDIENEFSKTTWNVHYWGGNLDSYADLSPANTSTYKGFDEHWTGQVRKYYVFTATIPAAATSYQVHSPKYWNESTDYWSRVASISNTSYFVWYNNERNFGVELVSGVPEIVEPGYYLAGSFNNWQPQSNYKFELNSASGDVEYYLNEKYLNQNDSFKVVGYWDTVVYYPGGDTPNKTIDTSDYYDIYFRPNGKDDQNWYYNTFYVGASPAKVFAQSLSIGDGDIAANFYLSFPEGTNVNGTEVNFTWNESETPKGKDTILDNEQKTRIINNKKCYCVTCHVPVAEMGDFITITFNLDGGEYSFENGSVSDCAYAYLNSTDPLVTDKAKAVAAAILNYGAACQKQFEYKQDTLVTENWADITNYEQPAIGNYTTDDIKSYEGDVAGNVPPTPTKTSIDGILNNYGLEYMGLSLLLRSKTTLRFYFKNKDENAYQGVSFAYGERMLETIPYEDDPSYCYVDVEDVGVTDLDVVQTLKIKKTDGDYSDLAQFSALSYIKTAIKKADALLTETLNTLYDYYKAAETWLPTNAVSVGE